MHTTEHPFGSWPSPLSPTDLATAGLRLGDVIADGNDIYWWEGRPTEGGRGVVVRSTVDGPSVDVTPADSNVRSLVHEYGGGAWTVDSGAVYYVDLADQQVHASFSDGTQRQITNERPELDRFADLTPHPDGRHILAVMERHEEAASEVRNVLVAINIESGHVRDMFGGTDFVSSPRPSPDGSDIAFITWSHPNMPWDETELRIVSWTPGGPFEAARVLVSGQGLQQPTWSGGRLTVITDETGWWLPHEVDVATGNTTSMLDAAIDAGVPPWVFGSGTIADHNGDIALMWQQAGLGHVGWIESDGVREIDVPFTDFGSITTTSNGDIVSAAASATAIRAVVVIRKDGSFSQLTSDSTPLTSAEASTPEHITFDSGDRRAHALFYPPSSAAAHGPDSELPPLLVLSHGGPTAAARPGFDLSIQFWTTRGFAVVDVNYGGSTGYGRAYRELLRDNWGIVDVEDCIAAARHLADTGKVDGDRLAIKGGSAGGYTTLAALAFHDVFAVGSSRYGVGDLESLARDTHKFESRYLDRLVGPYPDAKSIYVERSPIHATDQLTAPMIVLQGSEDKVVPPNQAESIVAALAARGLPHAYVLFDGEQHGFRNAENIARAVAAEYVFFCRVFGIEPSGEPVELEIIGDL